MYWPRIKAAVVYQLLNDKMKLIAEV